MHSLFGVIASGISGHLSSVFSSLYESFQALTSIQLSHYVETFSGSAISSTWTQTTVAGAPIFAMNDLIDGGFKITSILGNSSHGAISFGGKRHYSPTASEIIIIGSPMNDAGSGCRACDFGMYNVPNVYTNFVRMAFNSSNTYFVLGTGDASTSSETATDIALDYVMRNWHIVNGSSDIKLYGNGVLKATKTTNRPTITMQPTVQAVSSTASWVCNTRISYLESWNNTVTINSSLYERLSALTQLLSQRVVENFSGSAIQSQRWTSQDFTGTGVFAMVDSVDGGFSVKTGTSSGSQSTIDFNTKRQYDMTNSVYLAVVKAVGATDTRMQSGLDGDSFSNNFAFYNYNTANTYFELRTGDDTTVSSTVTDITIDQSWHGIKLVNGSSDILLYVDGVLKVTKTTNRPINKGEPVFELYNNATTTAAEGTIRYLEAYNKLTTETDYPSVYELFNPLTTVAKAHFWDWFSGNAIDTTRWTLTNNAGSGSGAMNDAVDGGYTITTGATSNNRTLIDFNNKRQYDQDACEIISVTKRISSTNDTIVGFNGNTAISLSYVFMKDDTDDTYKNLLTHDGTTASETNSDVAKDTAWTCYKGALDGTDVKMYINGVLKITKTTNYPTTKLQPMFYNINRGTGAQTGSIRYLEAYNT